MTDEPGISESPAIQIYRNMKELMADKESFTEPIVTDDHG
jgi:hypothetical protein